MDGVLAPGKLRMKAHAQFQQGRYLAFKPDAAGGRLCSASDHLQQGALAGSIDADDAESLSRRHLEAHIFQHPMQLVSRSGPGQEPFGQSRPTGRILPIGLAQL